MVPGSAAKPGRVTAKRAPLRQEEGRVDTDTTKQTGRQAPMSERTVRSIPVQDLLQGQKEVIIKHGQEEYRLRMTSNSKLILTK